MSDTIQRPFGCTCDREVGDSDCPAHPTCAECGADLSGHPAVAAALRLAAIEAHDALSNLRAGRWEIGYVKDRVDRITSSIRAALEGKAGGK